MNRKKQFETLKKSRCLDKRAAASFLTGRKMVFLITFCWKGTTFAWTWLIPPLHL